MAQSPLETGRPPFGGLPAFDPRTLARRLAVPAALAAVGAAAFLAAGGPVHALTSAIGRVAGADPAWVVAGAAFELLSFGGYIALLWLVGSRATERLNLRASAQLTLGGAAATRLLPAGGVGGVALTVWALRRSGLAPREAARTLMTFLVLLYAVFLGSIAVAGGLLLAGAGGGSAPLALSGIPAAGATLAIAAALVIAALRPSGTLGSSVRGAVVLARSADPRLLGAFVWWTFDGAVLWAMLHALGVAPSLPVVVLAYFLGQLANTLPVPGAVSGGMTGALVAFGVEADLALASVLAYRSLAIWIPAPVGLYALAGLRRTVAGWGEGGLVGQPVVHPAHDRGVVVRRLRRVRVHAVLGRDHVNGAAPRIRGGAHAYAQIPGLG
jgi:uncharacterized membrane protein YbhN (UPF0104 family)